MLPIGYYYVHENKFYGDIKNGLMTYLQNDVCTYAFGPISGRFWLTEPSSFTPDQTRFSIYKTYKMTLKSMYTTLNDCFYQSMFRILVVCRSKTLFYSYISCWAGSFSFSSCQVGSSRSCIYSPPSSVAGRQWRRQHSSPILFRWLL